MGFLDLIAPEIQSQTPWIDVEHVSGTFGPTPCGAVAPDTQLADLGNAVVIANNAHRGQGDCQATFGASGGVFTLDVTANDTMVGGETDVTIQPTTNGQAGAFYEAWYHVDSVETSGSAGYVILGCDDPNPGAYDAWIGTAPYDKALGDTVAGRLYLMEGGSTIVAELPSEFWVYTSPTRNIPLAIFTDEPRTGTTEQPLAVSPYTYDISALLAQGTGGGICGVALSISGFIWTQQTSDSGAQVVKLDAGYPFTAAANGSASAGAALRGMVVD